MFEKLRLWAEVILLFLAVPLVLAFFLPPSALYPVLGAATIVGIILLHLTPGFTWRSLLGLVHWGQVAGFGVLVFAVASALCAWLLPDRVWFLLRNENLVIIAMLTLLYPPILVFPQELVFRPLFFERYGSLFRSEAQRHGVNALLFSLAHLMYWHWVVLLLTFVGSFVFSMAYRRVSFLQAMALHSIAGIAVFASGLGWFFYSGGHVVQGG